MSHHRNMHHIKDTLQQTKGLLNGWRCVKLDLGRINWKLSLEKILGVNTKVNVCWWCTKISRLKYFGLGNGSEFWKEREECQRWPMWPGQRSSNS